MYGDRRKAVGRCEPTEKGNFLHKLKGDYILELAEKIKHKPDKKEFVFTDLVDGDQLRLSLKSPILMLAVSCTVPRPLKSTKKNLKKTADLLDFTVFKLLSNRKEAMQR